MHENLALNSPVVPRSLTKPYQSTTPKFSFVVTSFLNRKEVTRYERTKITGYHERYTKT